MCVCVYAHTCLWHVCRGLCSTACMDRSHKSYFPFFSCPIHRGTQKTLRTLRVKDCNSSVTLLYTYSGGGKLRHRTGCITNSKIEPQHKTSSCYSEREQWPFLKLQTCSSPAFPLITADHGRQGMVSKLTITTAETPRHPHRPSAVPSVTSYICGKPRSQKCGDHTLLGGVLRLA